MTSTRPEASARTIDRPGDRASALPTRAYAVRKLGPADGHTLAATLGFANASAAGRGVSPLTDLRLLNRSASVEQGLITVKTHTRELYRKLGAKSRADAVARADVPGLLELTESPG